MSYNFLGLVNDINNKMNEVPLTSSTFTGATGFYSDAKNAVNFAITDINTQMYEWPFNHMTKTLTLTVDESRYDFEADAKSVAMDTFRIKNDGTLANETLALFPIDYEEYLQKYSDMEYQPDIYHQIPKVVFRLRNLGFGVAPAPDKAYILEYEYYALPTALTAYTDIPSVPEIFRHVIFNGSMMYMYMFKGDMQAAAISKELFDKGLRDMEAIYITRQEYVRDTRRRGR